METRYVVYLFIYLFIAYNDFGLTFVDPCIIVQFIKKNLTRCNNVSNYIFHIPYLYEAQHVSGDTPPITRSLKLHWQPLVFFIRGRLLDVQLDVVRHSVPGNVHQLHVQTTFHDIMKNQRLPVQF